MRLMVNTPMGPKFHGEIKGRAFVRKVRKSKDLMRIYDAWSLNPIVLEKLQELDIKSIKYYDKENNKLWVTNREHFEKDVIKNTFSGGETLYLPLKFWHTTDDVQQSLL